MNPKPKIRLYVPGAYVANQELSLPEGQAHYVGNVMRACAGDQVAIFNGQDGEWLAEILHITKKQVSITAKYQRKPQAPCPDVWLIFAPIKNKTELVVEKATELGAAKIAAVFTQHAVVKSINQEKLGAHAVEAAEQCERMDVPAIVTYKDIAHMLAAWPKDRALLFADESGRGAVLKNLLPQFSAGKYAVLIGPEGGFSKEEQQMLHKAPMVKAFSLGPRILRADTAAVAALACVQAWLGDWEMPSSFESVS